MHRTDGQYHSSNTFVNGVPATGTPGTRVEEDWLNAVQEEICNVVEAAGITLAKGVHTQLGSAIARFATTPEVFTDTSVTANTLTIAPSTAFTAYAAGQIFPVKVANDNSGAATLNVSSLGAKAIKTPDGVSALMPGILEAGSVYYFYYNGTDFRILNPSLFSTLFIQPKTYYVDAVGGNDSNTGLDVGNPKLTIASVLSTYAKMRHQTVTIKLADGTYTENLAFTHADYVRWGNLIIEGDTATPGDVVLSGTVTITNHPALTMKGMRFSHIATNAVTGTNSNIKFEDVELYGTTSNYGFLFTFCDVSILPSASAVAFEGLRPGVSMSGGSLQMSGLNSTLAADQGSFINVAEGRVVIYNSATITQADDGQFGISMASGSSLFASGNITVNGGYGSVRVEQSVCTISGKLTYTNTSTTGDQRGFALYNGSSLSVGNSASLSFDCDMSNTSSDAWAGVIDQNSNAYFNGNVDIDGGHRGIVMGPNGEMSVTGTYAFDSTTLTAGVIGLNMFHNAKAVIIGAVTGTFAAGSTDNYLATVDSGSELILGGNITGTNCIVGLSTQGGRIVRTTDGTCDVTINCLNDANARGILASAGGVLFCDDLNLTGTGGVGNSIKLDFGAHVYYVGALNYTGWAGGDESISASSSKANV